MWIVVKLGNELVRLEVRLVFRRWRRDGVVVSG